ncbi:hypothetical protein AMELA_G00092640 [Ameiurus melas]|uniref:Uncharacterized protein n=1 Tax=Ameiurus melas TaxID=219545 RepID=A0A7J6AWK2_AMEME|nr:hypothetical protein AMELA_G00092640 [Ameiurus melas]
MVKSFPASKILTYFGSISLQSLQSSIPLTLGDINSLAFLHPTKKTGKYLVKTKAQQRTRPAHKLTAITQNGCVRFIFIISNEVVIPS